MKKIIPLLILVLLVVSCEYHIEKPTLNVVSQESTITEEPEKLTEKKVFNKFELKNLLETDNRIKQAYLMTNPAVNFILLENNNLKIEYDSGLLTTLDGNDVKKEFSLIANVVIEYCNSLGIQPTMEFYSYEVFTNMYNQQVIRVWQLKMGWNQLHSFVNLEMPTNEYNRLVKEEITIGQ